VGDSEWGHIPLRRVSAPVGLPRKARRHVCIDTFEWGHILLRSVHTRSYEWGTSQQQRSRISAFEWGKSHHWGLWMDRYRSHLRVGDIPATGVFLAASEWGHIPSSRRMAGCMSGPPPSERYLINGGFSWPPPSGGNPISVACGRMDVLQKVKH